MNTVQKVKVPATDEQPEKSSTENRPLQVVTGKKVQGNRPAPDVEKEPCYKDLSFWIRVAVGILLVVVALQYFLFYD